VCTQLALRLMRCVCAHALKAFPYFFLPLDDDLGLQTIEQGPFAPL
jgi:hypothetical protein